MKTFKIAVSIAECFVMTIEAESKEAALEKAQNITRYCDNEIWFKADSAVELQELEEKEVKYTYLENE